MTSTQDRPVRSAEAVAALRAASARETDPQVCNPDYLARHFVGGVYRCILGLPRRLSRWLIERMTPGSYGYFLARTRFVDEQLARALEQGAEQVVVLGAGYDSRAMRFSAQLAGRTVFEVDLPATQAAKRERIRQSGLAAPANVVYVPLDLNRLSLVAALREHGFSFERRTLFIWEGVTYYLQQAAVEDVLASVVAACAPGSTLILDYSLRSFVAGDESTYGGASMQRWLKKNGERFRFGLDPGELQRFLGRFRLAVTADLGAVDFERTYLTDRQSRLVGQPLGHLRMACATLEGLR